MADLALQTTSPKEGRQVILPRKGVMELSRLLSDGNEELSLTVGQNQIRATMTEYTLTS